MASNMKSSTGLVSGSRSTPLDTNSDGIYDSATFNFSNIVNYPEGAFKAITDTIMVNTVMLVSETYNYNGLNLDSFATFTYYNRLLELELLNSAYPQIATPSLSLFKSSVISSKYL
jgi:hypothetical protein